MTETKKRAAKLLRKYDQKRIALRELERELNKAVQAYACEEKLGWYNKDKFRLALQMESERLNAEARRNRS
jgi:hypothetical protein